MKKSLFYAREHMFQAFGKIIFAIISLTVMNAFFTVHWDPISGFILFITAALFLVINGCLEAYLGSEGEDSPALVVGSLLFIGASTFYYLVHTSDFAENPLRLINFCYFTLIANVLFAFVGPGIEKCQHILFKRSGLFAK